MNVRDLFSEAPSGLGFSLRREEVSEYFKIDGETRVITPPTDFKNFGVESDENSKRVWFEAPRIVGDEIDLSSLNLYVNYKNANGEVDKYYVEDVEVVDDKIYFSWKLERKPVRYKGTLTFIVCAVATDSKGVIQTEWNTTLCTGQVLEGLEVVTPEIPVEESDIINQLIDLVKETSSKAVADVEAAKTEAIASIETAGSPIFANALKATASGEVVRVDDVSPLEHMARVKVSGKNLIDPARVRASGCAIVDGNITANVNNSYYADIVCPYLNDLIQNSEGKTITLSADTSNSEHKIAICILYTDKSVIQSSLSTSKTSILLQHKGKTIQSVIVRPFADNSSYTDSSSVVKNLQLEFGDTATEYEPWIDPTTVTVTRYGADESDNAQTFAPNADGTLDIISLSPTMTLLTDTAGVNIDLVYNRDLNVAFEALIKTINSMTARLLVRTVAVSLLASKWVETDGIYSQVVTIADTTPYSKVDLQPSVEQLTVFYEKDISFTTENEGGVITVYCVGQKPTSDYVMQATITEVNANA
jgi:hypothetical protein